MWHAVYDTETGALMSSGSSVAQTLPAGRSVKTFASRPPDGMGWNAATLAYDLPLPVRPVQLSRLEFMSRLTGLERVSIRAAAADDPIIDDFLDMLSMAEFVTLGHPLITQGLAHLVAVELITQARSDEIGGG